MDQSKLTVKTIIALYNEISRPDGTDSATISEYRLLSFLGHGPLRAVDLAAELQVKKSAVTSTIDKLGLKHWIHRTVDKLDQRCFMISISPLGEKTLRDFETQAQRTLIKILDRKTVVKLDNEMDVINQKWSLFRARRYQKFLEFGFNYFRQVI